VDLLGLVEAPDQITAEMWCELLKREGIPSFTKLASAFAYSDIMFGPLSPTGCWVMVREDDLDRATAILGPMIEGKGQHRRRHK
jgi:hypothetical protein